MITQTIPTWQTRDWREELRDVIRELPELLDRLALREEDFPRGLLPDSPFALRVPLPYANRMEKGNPHDPLLRQVIPLGEEELDVPGFVADPLAEREHNPAPGVIHKYRGRVLLIATPVCAINCRYCFRRHFPYEENTPGRAQWSSSLEYIAADADIEEVILSGGDPLATSDRQLAWLTERIAAIPHVRRLRVHTRLPVVIPARVDEACLSWLSETRLQTVMVLHINHGNEIDDQVAAMAQRLRRAGVTLLNQTVLLRGVNDSAATLAELSDKLFDIGVLPYYLHLLDPVSGAAHFEIPDAQAQRIHSELQARVPGYLLPRLVRDRPGEPAKVQVAAYQTE